MSELDFREVLEKVKEDSTVRFTRTAWGDRTRCIWGEPPIEVSAEDADGPVMEAVCRENGGRVQVLGSICGCFKGMVQPGISLNHDDMMADDWEVVA